MNLVRRKNVLCNGKTEIIKAQESFSRISRANLKLYSIAGNRKKSFRYEDKTHIIL